MPMGQHAPGLPPKGEDPTPQKVSPLRWRDFHLESLALVAGLSCGLALECLPLSLPSPLASEPFRQGTRRSSRNFLSLISCRSSLVMSTCSSLPVRRRFASGKSFRSDARFQSPSCTAISMALYRCVATSAARQHWLIWCRWEVATRGQSAGLQSRRRPSRLSWTAVR